VRTQLQLAIVRPFGGRDASQVAKSHTNATPGQQKSPRCKSWALRRMRNYTDVTDARLATNLEQTQKSYTI
jgi:hypothetical protein